MRLALVIVAIILFIVLGGAVGTLLVRDPGYVMMSYGNLVLETSLWVGLVLLIVTNILVLVTIYTLRKIFASPNSVLSWRSGRRLRNARSQTLRGLLVMLEGRWGDAQKLLLAGAPQVDTPLVNYLNAAKAAHELGDHPARDAHLESAVTTTPGAKFAISLTRAEFHIDENQHGRALEELAVLRKRAPKHKAVMRMQADCFEALQDWTSLAGLLKDMEKNLAVSPEEMSRLREVVWNAQLQSELAVKPLLKKVPKALRRNSDMMSAWVLYLVEQGRCDEAEYIARTVLADVWDARIVATYGEIESSDVTAQLGHAKAWLKDHANDHVLLLCLGRLCLMTEKFEQARSHFEASLKLQESQEVYGELGRLSIAMGDERRGADYLLQSLSYLADLPQPKAKNARFGATDSAAPGHDKAASA